MIEMIVEAVLVSFCVGGALGSVITMHLQKATKRREVRIEERHSIE